MKQCKRCKKPLEDDEIFCSNCGEPVNSEEESSIYGDETNPFETKEPLNDGGKGKKIAIGALAAILLISIVGFFVISMKTPSQELPQAESNQESNEESYGEGQEVSEDEENVESTGDVDTDTVDSEEKIAETEQSTVQVVESYSSDENNNGDYILPDSSNEILEYSDIQYLSKDELRLARNEIYARHGRRFNDSSLQSYFNSKSWYNGRIDPDNFDDDAILSDVEMTNVKFIRSYE